MASVKALANHVHGGVRTLDVPTVKKLMRRAVRDKRIDTAEELEPLRALMKDGSVAGTVMGRRLLASFVKTAESSDTRVKKMPALAVFEATKLADRDALHELIIKFHGTAVPAQIGNAYTHAHEANDDIEGKFLEATGTLKRYMDSALVRFFTSKGKKVQLENDPLGPVREYLEKHYEKIE